MIKKQNSHQQKTNPAKSIFLSILKLANKKIADNRYNFISFFIFVSFAAITTQLFHLQILKHSDTDKYVNNIVYKETTEKQKRAAILDRNGNILAMSVKKYTVYLDAKMIDNLDEIEHFFKSLGIEIPQKQYNLIEQRKSYIPIAYNLDEYVALQIESKKLSGVGLENNYIRQYPEEKMASHLLGKVNSLGKGTYGIEKFCNSQLTGKNVQRRKYKIADKQIFADKLAVNKNSVGNDIKLTIDRKLQFIVEQALSEVLTKTKAKRAMGIIQDPHTGEILAMGSLPNFNPNEQVTDMSVLINPITSSEFEPGSTFKVIVLAAVLEEKKFKPSDKINCENGKLKVAGETISDHDKQKIITVAQVIERSSNIGTAKLALNLGKDLFYKYIKMFGFDSLTGIDLGAEIDGRLQNTSGWSARSLHTISFGQEISATPLQITNAFSTIANGGVLLKPKIIKSIGEEQYSSKEVIRRVISEETAGEIRKILKGVVDDGTGKAAKINGYTVGGKTGTAQKWDNEIKKYSKKHYFASFCGMIPAEKPKIVIYVGIDEPKGDYYAASVAAPVFAKIAANAMIYLGIEKDDADGKNN